MIYGVFYCLQESEVFRSLGGVPQLRTLRGCMAGVMAGGNRRKEGGHKPRAA